MFYHSNCQRRIFISWQNSIINKINVKKDVFYYEVVQDKTIGFEGNSENIRKKFASQTFGWKVKKNHQISVQQNHVVTDIICKEQNVWKDSAKSH